MKKGYHSTQRKYFNTVPRSEFYGLAVGYAVGLIFAGLFHDNGQKFQLAGVIIGVAIGYWIDSKYYAEKDVPVEEIEATAQETAAYAIDETDPDYDGVGKEIDETDPDYDGVGEKAEPGEADKADETQETEE